MKSIRIASRASKLALIQSNHIRDLLCNLCPEAEISLVKVTTKGDRDKSDFLHKSVGFFTSEVERAILDDRADLAVHSFKDLPTAPTAGLTIAAIPKRASAADALVASGRVASISDLPTGATVGTSSVRRIAQLRYLRSDLKCVPLRGNVETRVGKVTAAVVIIGKVLTEQCLPLVVEVIMTKQRIGGSWVGIGISNCFDLFGG